MEVWLKDEKTGMEMGLNDDGELFLGNESSGGNCPDTIENRKKMIKDFCKYTGRQMPVISAGGKPISGCSLLEFSR